VTNGTEGQSNSRHGEGRASIALLWRFGPVIATAITIAVWVKSEIEVLKSRVDTHIESPGHEDLSTRESEDRAAIRVLEASAAETRRAVDIFRAGRTVDTRLLESLRARQADLERRIERLEKP